MHEQALHAVGVLCTGAERGTHGAADDHRQFIVFTVHETPLCHAVEDLGESNHGKVGVHQLGNGTQTGDGSAQSGAHDGCFRNRSIADTLGAKLFQHATSDTKNIAKLGNVFAKNQDLFIAPHLFLQGGTDGLKISFLHLLSSLPLTHTGS